MAQIPRPLQLALVVVVLLAGVWLFALQGHPSSPSTASSTTAPEVTSTVSSAPSPARTSARRHTSSLHSSAAKTGAGAGHTASSGHGSLAATPAPTGSSHTTAAAHKSVAAHKSAATMPQGHARKVSPTVPQHRTTSATRTAATVTRHGASATKHASALATPTGQREVEAELKQGKIVVVLFWNPAGSDDQVVHKELRLLLQLHRTAAKARAEEVRSADRFFGLELDKQIAVHEAQASQVAQYGSITRGVQVYATPTLLVINPRGQAIVRTGLIDAYAIEQAIEEARAA